MAEATPREAYRQFTTGVALITTHGSKGPNVMAAEWTFHVSYDPFLISVHIHPDEATHEAIDETKEFGVNIVGDHQVPAMAFAGHFSHRAVDKLSSSLFETYPATKIRAPLVRGALLNAECKVVQQIPMGDHTAFVGEVVAFAVNGGKKPVVLHRGARHLGRRIEREPVVAVAATPRRTVPGGRVRAVGELMAPDREDKAVALTLRDPDGREVAAAETNTDDRGRFETELALPADVTPGDYVLRARAGEVRGTASLRVGTGPPAEATE